MIEITKKLLLCFCIALFTLPLVAQETIRLSGQIIDVKTKEPLAFSTINIAGTTTGAVSNFEGYFEFSFERQDQDDSIIVSMLGYRPVEKAIKDLSDLTNLTIELEESITLLKEVEVNERKLTALDIVNRVIENIPDNYPNEPYLIEGFTRSHSMNVANM